MSDGTNVALPSRLANGVRPVHYSHAGAGPLNVNAGAGVQKNYNLSGSGNRQYNADVINIKQADARPEYTGTYSYTSLHPVANYVARPELQKQVEERLNSARAAGAAQNTIVILVGLGGAGKSQLALNHIHTHREDYSAVFWVDARLRESVERDYLQIHGLLFGGGQDAVSVQLDVVRVITAVKSWFHGRNGRWLFVFDNADSLDDESDHYFVNLRRYLPDAPGIDVIVTTRSRTAVDMTELEAVEVGKLAPAEAVDIFMRCSRIRDPRADVLEEMGRIVTELDHLALAVTLAGAYVAATPRIRSNIREYLPEYRRRRKALLSRRAIWQIHQYGESVLSTWETSCKAIAKQCPTAVRLLSFFAFLDPEDIFLELFRPKADSLTTLSDDRGEEWRGLLSPDAPLVEVLDEALEALSTYSFIQWKEEQGGYSMHKLVHAWGFHRLDADEQGEYSKSSLAFLGWVVQERRLDLVTKRRMPAHMLSSVARLREWHGTSAQIPQRSLDAIGSLADFVRDTGQYHAEYELRSFDQVEREGLKEQDERGWLCSLSDLAVVLSRQGKYDAAEEMNRRALEGREKVLGKEHPSTLTSVSNLASVLRYQGKYEAAEEMNRRALEGSEKVLRKGHPDTLTSVGNLALVLQHQGKYEAAEEINRRALEGREKVLGKEHPDTLTSVGNLAGVLQHQRKYEAAEEMNRRALEGREKVLGKEHPDTLTSVDNLAGVLQRQGKYEAAEEINRRALEGREKVLGKEHPDTLTSVSNLAGVLQHQRKYEAAEEINRRALEGSEKVLGKEHPDTLTSVSNLAGVLQHQRKYEAAEEMNRRALEGSEKVLGKEHPDTLISVWCLAALVNSLGRRDEAIMLYERASTGFVVALGEQHPHTLECQQQYRTAKGWMQRHGN